MRAPAVWAAFLLWALSGGWGAKEAYADPSTDARTAIQQMYAQQAEATALKFTPGIMAHQTFDFEMTMPAGDKLRRPGEKALYSRLFARRLDVKDTFRLVSFHLTDATQAVCEVQETLEVGIPGATPRASPSVAVIESQSRDLWILTRQGWREKSVTIRKQTITRRPTPPSHG